MTSYCIGDICSFVKGASIPRNRMFVEGDFRYLHYGDLYRGHELYVNIERPQKPIQFISADEKLRNDQFIDDGDIIYVLTSETIEDLGKALYLRNPNHHSVVAGTETTVMRVRRGDIVDPAWLNYLIQSPQFKRTLRQYVTGMKVFRVHPRDISRINVEIPSLDRQRQIVTILDAIHEKILTNSEINDYLAA